MSNNLVATIATLVDDSPITKPTVLADIRELLRVGEEGLAFDTLCTWIYEDSLPIKNEFHSRLLEIGERLGSTDIVERLRELIVNT